jgi:hypothetical protein
MNVRLPANLTAEVWVPRREPAADATVELDGTPRQGRVEGAFLVIAPVGSGTHQLSRTFH